MVSLKVMIQAHFCFPFYMLYKTINLIPKVALQPWIFMVIMLINICCCFNHICSGFHYCNNCSTVTICALSLTGFVMRVAQVAVPAVGFAAASWTAELYVPAHCPTALMATLLPPLHTAIRCTQTPRQGGLAAHKQSKSSGRALWPKQQILCVFVCDELCMKSVSRDNLKNSLLLV